MYIYIYVYMYYVTYNTAIASDTINKSLHNPNPRSKNLDIRGPEASRCLIPHVLIFPRTKGSPLIS